MESSDPPTFPADELARLYPEIEHLPISNLGLNFSGETVLPQQVNLREQRKMWLDFVDTLPAETGQQKHFLDEVREHMNSMFLAFDAYYRSTVPNGGGELPWSV